MKSGFSDPIKSKVPSISNRNPWGFDAPQYDERSSSFINAGVYQGVGYKQPVGHEGNAKQDVPCLPRGKVHTMVDDAKG